MGTLGDRIGRRRLLMVGAGAFAVVSVIAAFSPNAGAELGGALGISILGSISVALYRGDLAESLPADLPAEAGHSARDTLGAAVQVAATLPERLGDSVLLAARAAFLDGVHVTATIAGVAALALSVVTVLRLRHIPAGAPSDQP